MKGIMLLTLVVCIMMSGAALCRTWYITPDGTGDAPTIQAGVDSAANEDTVLVAAGTYYERISISASDGGFRAVYLISETGPTSTTIIGDPDWPVVSSFTDFAKVEGFGITGSGDGIYYCFSGAEVVGNVVWDCADFGIFVFSPSAHVNPEPLIKQNVVYASGVGISISGAAGPSTRFASNTVFGCWQGISINNPAGSPVHVLKNIVSACWMGIAQCTATDPYPCAPPVLECNVVWGNDTNYFGTEPGETDMVVCPMLCYAHLGDFRVCYDSPCLPENNPYGCQVGACGAGCECGPSKTVSATWGSIKSMYR